MKIDVGEMLGILPKEILDFEDEYNEVGRLGYNSEYNVLCRLVARLREQKSELAIPDLDSINVFQDILESAIEEVEESNLPGKNIIDVFILKLIEPVRLEMFFRENEELAKKFILKVANIVVKYAGYEIVCRWPYDNFCAIWRMYKRITDEKEYLSFLQKLNTEIGAIIDIGDEKSEKELLPKISDILNFFNSMAINATKDAVDELDKITVVLLNLCTKYEYKLDCLSYPRVPLTEIFGRVKLKETKNLIMKYLMEYADYFQGLEMDSRECVINTVYPDEEKSEVLRMYLENALLLKREDLYSGPVFDKVFNKLFREVEAERNGELYSFGEDSPDDFSKALLVIEEICNNPDSFKMLSETDFFDKVYGMFNYFILVYYKSKKSVDLQPALESQYLDDTESKMKLSFFKLCLTIRKQ